MRLLRIAVITVLFALLSLAIVAQESQSSSQSPNSAGASKSNWQDSSNEGEKRFKQNCGRCHTPPSSISPRISKTVLRHMRVRANLSKEDEQYILKFLAPSVQP